MSKVVDERVVEMRFDNRHFEQNVSTTMSTLEKLKSKLKFSGASKGLTELNGHTSIVKKNMDVLGQGVQSVQREFSSLSVIGATCLVNITNSAIRAGKNIVNALTLDPVKTGFQEYETKIGAIQTILANTESKGENIESVTRVIDELNTYADKTIYNFSEMTRNIGTFTAAGVGLQESADAIQGIANVAAMSGSTSQQASTAMYQLSQALAAGTVKLQDWNSVVNAGMGGQKLQDALKQTAREFGTNVDDMITEAGSFRESLKDGWITADVLNTTLKKFTVEGAKEYAQSMLECGKYTQEQADALIKEAQTAEDAATKVKTLTQLWDTLKETAQSGWGKTWELIIGDFEEAKEFFTKLSDKFGPMIDAMSDARNNLIEGALSSKWELFSKQVEDAGGTMDGFKAKLAEVASENGRDLNKMIECYGSLEKVITKGYIPVNMIVEALKRMGGVSENTTDKLKYFQEVVDKVWAGDYGNNNPDDRIKALTEAGYDFATVQDLVNKTIDGHRLTLEDVSDAQLENIGYTQEEIANLRKLAEEAGKTGTPINELVNSLTKKSGRELLLDSLMNAINGIVKVCSTLKQAWQDVFPPMTSERLYGIIESINAFSKKLIMSDESAEKLRRTFKGLFAIIDVVGTVLNAGFKIVLEAISAILSYFNLDILDVTASIGDMAVQLRDWIDKTIDVKAAINFLMPYIEKAVKKVRELGKIFKETSIGSKLFSGDIKSAFKETRTWIQTNLTNIKTTILNFFKNLPNTGTDLFNSGKSMVIQWLEGIQNEISTSSSKLANKLEGMFNKAIEIIRKIDFGQVAAGFLMGGLLHTINSIAGPLGNIAEAVKRLTAPFQAMADAITLVGKATAKLVKAKAFETRARGFLELAIAIGIMAGAVYILAKLNRDELTQGLIALGIISGIIVALGIVANKLGKVDIDGEIATTGILKMAAGLLIIAIALKVMSGIKPEEIQSAITGLAAALSALVILMFVVEKMTQKNKVMMSAGSMLLKMALAIGVMVLIVKIAAGLEKGEVIRGIAVVGAIELLFIAAIAVSKLAGQYGSAAGSMLLKMSIAMGIMVGVVKLAASISKSEVDRAMDVLWGVEAMFILIMSFSRLAGQNASKAGSMMFKMALAMAVMALVVRMIAKMDPADVDKGIAFITRVSHMFALIIGISKFAGKNAARAGVLLIGMAVAMAALVGCMYLMTLLKPEQIKTAVTAISILIGMMSVLVASSGLAGKATGTVVAIAVAVAILCGALVALSFLKPEKLLSATAALSVILLSLAAVFAGAKGLENVKISKVIVMFAGLAVLLGLIAGVLITMSLLKVQDALPNAAALSTLLLAMSVSMVIISKMSEMDSGAVNRAGVLMLELVVVLEGLALVLHHMDKMDVQANMSNVAALCILLIAMTGVAFVLSKMGTMSWGDVGRAGAMMGGLVIILEGLALVLNHMQEMNIQANLGNVAALCILLGMMTLVVIAISRFMGNMSWGDVGRAGAMMAGLVIVVAGLAYVLKLIDGIDPVGAIANAVALSIFVNALSIAMVILSHVTSVSISALGGVLALSAVCYILGLVLKSIDGIDPVGAIANAVALSVLVLALSVACRILAPIGALGPEILLGAAMLLAVALAIEAAVWVFNKIIAPDLPDVGKNLGDFMTNLKPFIDGVKKIDDSAIAGCKNIAAMIGALAGASIKDSVMSFFGGDNWTSGISDTLQEFATAMVGFSNTLTQGNFNAEAVNAAANAGQMLATLQESLPKTGGKLNEVIKSIVGENDMTGFGTQLESFGASMVKFSKSVEGINPDAIGAAKDAGLMLTELADTIPNSGGKLAEWLGDNTMDTFGTQLESFGKSMSAFSKSITGENAIDPEAVQSAAEAGKALADMANEIPNEGGWLAKIVGDNQIDTFGAKLPKFGEALAGFGEEVEGVKPGPIKAAAEAGKYLAEMAANIPNEGGWISKIVGDNKLDTFAANIGKLGEGMKTFSDKITGVKVENFSIASTAASTMKDVVANLPKSDALKDIVSEKGIQKLDSVLPSLMTTLQVASKSISGVNVTGLTDAVSNVDKLVAMLTKIGGTDFGGVDSFVGAINELGKASVDKFVNAFKEGASTAAAAAQDMVTKTVDRIKFKLYLFKTEGQHAIEKFAEGIKGSSSKAETAASNASKNAASKAKDGYSDMYSAGSYLIDGLKAGISENAYKAAEAASTAMVSAIKAAKEAAGINSPSKVFYEMGGFTVAGFVNALDDLGNKVYDSGYGMADNARKGFSNAISRITSSFDEDTLQPTIRPVLDLSSVEAGAGTINSMFGKTASVGLLSNVNAIGSMMANRQNGPDNSDVVSAIDKLRKEVGNVGGTTNYINGITYDDGSNVTDAVATLVRAAKIERRR